MKKRQQGQSLVEVVVGITMMALIGMVSTSAASAAGRRLALMSAVSQLRAELSQTRQLAIAHQRNIAFRFRDDGDGWTWRLYEDRDGDGVRNDDIAAGIDRPLRMAERPPKGIDIATPSKTIPDPSTNKPLSSRSPVRFNASQLCAFAPDGQATNGSVVLTDGTNVAVVEVQGTTARISVKWWTGGRWVDGL